MSPGTNLIEVRNFSFAIRDKQILKEISLDVRQGEYCTIVGPNGAGKTTLIKCLNRILRGGTGVIRIAGKPVEAYSQRELARLISYVPQANGLIAPFSVYEFVMMGRYPYSSPFSPANSEDKRAVREALELTGTEALADQALGTLSGGERQKVLIAAALVQGAGILLLDEPTTFLDPRHVGEIHRLLLTLHRERRCTIVSVSHDINAAALISERIVALKQGTVAFSGRTEEFMNQETLQHIYEKAFVFMKHPGTGKTIVVPEGVV
jgi:iron complex transport system ATP-binding protein